MTRLWLYTVLAALPFSAHSSEAVGEKRQAERKAPDGPTFSLEKSPSLRWGKLLRIDFRAKFQNDFRAFEPGVGAGQGLYELNRARIGVEGKFLKTFEFELEREMSDTQNPWKDMFIDWRRFRPFRIKGGRFKLPFGMEQLTGPTQMDFVYRAGISAYLAPGRDTGVMAHGRLLQRSVTYEAGVFRHDGDNARIKDNERAAGRTLAARLTVAPLLRTSAPALLKDLELGGAFTSGAVEEGSNSLRGRTAGQEYFFRRLEVNGNRLRVGTQLAWKNGPAGIKGEYIQVRDQRLGQGVAGNDVPDLISRGWYLSGTWMLLEPKEGPRVGQQSFAQSIYAPDNAGAVQVAVRYEQLRFGSSAHPGQASRSSRAANILGNSNRALTLGANWTLNRHVRIQVNAVREKVEDAQRRPAPGREHFWTRLCRLQFVL